VIKSIVFGFAVTFIALLSGLRSQTDPGRRVARHDQDGRVRLAAVLGLDFLLTALMFS
jgi:phospholipid/cholesterol/gamma-HCH transport system permease protein